MENSALRIDPTIIVVETNPGDRISTAALLSQQGWKVRDTDNSYEAIQWLKAERPPDLLIIADNATPLNAGQAIDYIRLEIRSEIPIVVAHDDGNNINNYGRETDYFVRPFGSMHIETIRKIIGSEAEETGHVYSLNYLNMLADGNRDFVMDCLSVFKTSVAAKLNQLSDALQQKDYKAIGEIAHNIKPSFEMLESNISAEICNKLTYSSTEAEFPELAMQLNKQFNKIINKLSADFPELK